MNRGLCLFENFMIQLVHIIRLAFDRIVKTWRHGVSSVTLAFTKVVPRFNNKLAIIMTKSMGSTGIDMKYIRIFGRFEIRGQPIYLQYQVMILHGLPKGQGLVFVWLTEACKEVYRWHRLFISIGTCFGDELDEIPSLCVTQNRWQSFHNFNEEWSSILILHCMHLELFSDTYTSPAQLCLHYDLWYDD